MMQTMAHPRAEMPDNNAHARMVKCKHKGHMQTMNGHRDNMLPGCYVRVQRWRNAEETAENDEGNKIG